MDELLVTMLLLLEPSLLIYVTNLTAGKQSFRYALCAIVWNESVSYSGTPILELFPLEGSKLKWSNYTVTCTFIKPVLISECRITMTTMTMTITMALTMTVTVTMAVTVTMVVTHYDCDCD